ncbi:archaellin/type IV pilin N-terminal domain-containing protein [Archaeoglobus sp.]
MIRDSRSVSPIVGLILMVVVTVILVTAIFKISNVYFQSAPTLFWMWSCLRLTTQMRPKSLLRIWEEIRYTSKIKGCSSISTAIDSIFIPLPREDT